MSWVYLVMAGLCEMLGVGLINYYNQEKSMKSVFFLIIAFGLSFFCLNLAMNEITMGTAYAIWTGIGAAGGAIMGMIFYGEKTDKLRLLCLALIIFSAIGLKIVS